MCCRIDRHSTSSTSSDLPTCSIYLMTLGVLAPYRRLGLAKSLLTHLLKVASPGTIISLPLSKEDLKIHEEKESAKEKAAAVTNRKTNNSTNVAKSAEELEKEKKKKKVTPKVETEVKEIYLHVQVGNDEAKSLYEGMGWKVEETVKDYYRRNLDQRDAWLLKYQTN